MKSHRVTIVQNCQHVLETPKGRLIPGSRTLVIGILNVTTDSFSDGGRYLERERAVERALEMAEEGADIIDIGGESTRPGARPISLDEELKRVIPVVQELVKRLSVPISIDTTKARVAKVALENGASIVNDVSALRFDTEMASSCARNKAGVILMHMRGTPQTMQRDTRYDNLIQEIFKFLKERVKFAVRNGIARETIAIDPGIGFGKSPEDNMRIIKNLEEFKVIGRPIVLGTSRKSFIGHVLKVDVMDRLEGTAATVVAGVMNGAHMVRVHDVKAMRRVVDMVDAIKNSDEL
ncbi:MAG: dihydropteroate synthase [Deltaproteobacteria bacterium]|nr:dihydropteroate synthase [Deltaproteobacteria bacterium]